MFYKKSVLRDFAKLTGKHLCQSLFFNEVLKNRLWDRCFSVNFAKLLRTPFFMEHLRWLLLTSLECKTYIIDKVIPKAKKLIKVKKQFQIAYTCLYCSNICLPLEIDCNTFKNKGDFKIF